MMAVTSTPHLALPLVLASASPRRRALLARLGLRFAVAAPDVDERSLAGEPAGELARRLALAKATAAACLRSEAIVLAADTVVSVDGEPLGKPADAAEAESTLRRLRGGCHQVITAVAVVRPRAAPLLDATATTVFMRDYHDAEIAAYVASGEPLDKAGAYAIQDPVFRPVARIEGCYTNVVGLPLCVSARLLRDAGLTVPSPETICEHGARPR